ncbi:MAG: preprotein translocase subunit YajC [Akkermansiaceae bacterium]|nr:preprotein translocase subunit YajC [Akkermansiaceae bacterium]
MISPTFLAAANPASGSGSILGSPIIMIIILFVMMWVLMIRPQQKQRKAQEARIASLKKGDKIVTIGGMHGSVHHISDKTVTIKISEGIFVPFDKASIRDVTKKTAGGESSPSEEVSSKEVSSEEDNK